MRLCIVIAAMLILGACAKPVPCFDPQTPADWREWLDAPNGRLICGVGAAYNGQPAIGDASSQAISNWSLQQRLNLMGTMRYRY